MAAKLLLGLMSGTSMDGIDAALIKTDGDEYIQSIASSFHPYSAAFKRCLKCAEAIMTEVEGNLSQAAIKLSKHIIQADPEVQQLFTAHHFSEISFDHLIQLSTYLHQDISEQLLRAHNIHRDQVSYVGYHGQTLYHAPHLKLTQQIGDCQLLANNLHIPVVGKFRINDLQHDGQGAPLTPIYHWALAKQDGLIPIAIINCGGIANVSFVLDDDPEQIIAFDTGPGNVLLDRFVREKTAEKYFYDKDGHWALKGSINEKAFIALQNHSLPQNYLRQAPPKSLDSHHCQLPELFNTLSIEDGCATLAAFSAACIVHSLDFCPQQPSRWVLAGGGWHNLAILNQFKIQLEARFKKAPQILTAHQLGWQQDTLEAEAFAYLAQRVAQKLPLTFPKTTGVSQPLTGGEIFYPRI